MARLKAVWAAQMSALIKAVRAAQMSALIKAVRAAQMSALVKAVTVRVRRLVYQTRENPTPTPKGGVGVGFSRAYCRSARYFWRLRRGRRRLRLRESAFVGPAKTAGPTKADAPAGGATTSAWRPMAPDGAGSV
ncbi:hypothetical protein GCM10009765_42580 [Fodinicola feengrottensis]|uniref:Uncharacterized protein n=1 Tax=Fodinicola feengrottensis TaxID=435914 RepID=A0ABN2HIP2_9ACTN